MAIWFSFLSVKNFFFLYLDLFSGVDFFFFNFSFLQGGFVFFSCLWIFFSFYYSYFFNLNFRFFFFFFLQRLVLKRLKSVMVELKGFIVIIWSVFLFILFRKFFGLLPYVYGKTTNFYFVLFFSFWIWGSLIFSSFFIKFKGFIAHFCPEGSPIILAGFLRIIEFVSVGIRPFTLTLRLVAKMTTGHILIGLITLSSRFLFLKSKIFLTLVVLFFLAVYVLFELVICFVQGKVFFMLLSNYSREHL